MKICFISTFFTGATLPLVHHIQKRGHQCDFYLFAEQERDNLETLDFDNPIVGNGIQRISKENSIYSYLDKNINISIVPYYLVKNRKYLIGFIPFFKNIHIIDKLLEEIEFNCYDFFYVIVNEENDGIIVKKLYQKGYKNVVIAYHEVLKSHTEEAELKDVVASTLKLGYPVICYSNHTKKTLENQIARIGLNSLSLINTIYFGPFETYQRYDISTPIVEEPYILFIGSIQPYKGLPFFYESIRDYGENLTSKIVIAGSGYDSRLEDMKKDDRYMIINRYLSDSEFANLTCHASCIVCPYVSGSQSGITHTAMVFGTPVIATKVGAFPEFIQNGMNGELVDYGCKQQFVETILSFISKTKRSFFIPNHLKWENIAKSLEYFLYYQNNEIPSNYD